MWRVLEILAVLLVFAFAVTQMFIPVLNNRRMFPLFRRTAKLEKTLVDINDLEAEVNLQHEVEERLSKFSRPEHSEAKSSTEEADITSTEPPKQ